MSSLAQLPAPIIFSPSDGWYGNDGPWSSFGLRIGVVNESQRIRVFPAFSISLLFVVDKTGCPTGREYWDFMSSQQCDEARGGVFDAANSSDWQSLGSLNMSYGNFGLGYLDTDGMAGSETVGLTWDDTQPMLSNQLVATVTDITTYWFGVFGLSPNPTLFQDNIDGYPTFFDGLKTTGRIAGNSWSYTAGSYHHNFSASLIFAGYDSSKFDAETSLQISMGPEEKNTFVVQIHKIHVSGITESDEIVSEEQFEATLEPALPYMFVEKSICAGFERVFNLSYDAGSDLYFVPHDVHERLLSEDPSIKFTVCGQHNGSKTVCKEFPLPYAAFALNASYPLLKYPNGSSISSYLTRRYFAIKQSTDSNAILGRVFLQETHVFADFDRHFFNLSRTLFDRTAESRVSIVQAPSNATDESPTSSSLTTGGIVGIAIATVIAVATAIYLAFAKLKSRWPFKPAPPAADEPGKPELDGTGRLCVEMSSPDRKGIPGAVTGAEKPDGLVNPGQDAELMGSIPLYELPATARRSHEVVGQETVLCGAERAIPASPCA